MDAFIIDAVRSPIGKRAGSLSAIRGDEAAAQVLDALLVRVDCPAAELEDVQLGCATQVGEQGWNLARAVPLIAGWPETVCGATVDRQCGSSATTAMSVASAIMAGQLDLAIAGGVEMMSRVPMGSSGGDPSSLLYERFELIPQGISAEVIAREWEISRESQDLYALESHIRAARAQDEGRFTREIVPVTLPDGEVVAADEAIRRDTSLERLAALKPVFVDIGTVTAGNSSQIVDGVSGALVASAAAVDRLGFEPRARFVSFGLAGVDPHRMLHGNPLACERALRRAGLDYDDVAVIEVNEAFASVVLQFLKDTGLEERWRQGDVNGVGGGISLGHPLGATGTRLLATALSELERRQERYALISMCVALGQAVAYVIERV
jgi:acetyl-CoA acyltransferase